MSCMFRGKNHKKNYFFKKDAIIAKQRSQLYKLLMAAKFKDILEMLHLDGHSTIFG